LARIGVTLGGTGTLDAKTQLNADIVLTITAFAILKALIASTRLTTLSNNTDLRVGAEIAFIELAITIVIRQVTDLIETTAEPASVQEALIDTAITIII
jgi:hypothetical protein